MGKVQSSFPNGYAGTPSRSVDNVIISRKNASGAAIPFGAPVFLKSDGTGVLPFASGTTTATQFLGFAVRVPDKNPETYGSNLADYSATDPVDILARGSVILPIVTTSAQVGNSVYVRVADGKLVTVAGAEGSTVQLPGVTVATARDASGTCEVVLRARNLL